MFSRAFFFQDIKKQNLKVKQKLFTTYVYMIFIKKHCISIIQYNISVYYSSLPETYFLGEST